MSMSPASRKRTIFVAIAIGVVLLFLIVRVVHDRKVKDNPLPAITNTSTTNSNAFVFRSADTEGFSATFPDQPTRHSETIEDANFGSYTYTTYQRANDRAVYLIAVYDYSANAIIDDPNFDVYGGLEGALNGMVNAAPGSQILSATKTTFLGKLALQFEADVQTDRMDGLVTYANGRVYLIALGYRSGTDTKNDLAAFLQSFSFNN